MFGASYRARRYSYTFPSARIRGVSHTVSMSKFPLTVCQPNVPNGLVMRSRPYRNDRIIAVIRGLYFTATAGVPSFASRFRYLFPTYETCEGELNYEVPVPMVALVSTAVSH